MPIEEGLTTEKELETERNRATLPQKPEKYPKCVFFILGDEVCERFSFYVLSIVLLNYLIKELQYSEYTARNIFRGFITVCTFSPFFGAAMADSFLSKYQTIFGVSFMYTIGVITLSIGAIPMNLLTMKIISFASLLVIMIGTGGIKPYVAAFSGDQFSKTQVVERKQFFSLYYFAVNLGNVLSIVVVPFLKDTPCFGRETCFPLNFGVPAAMMIIALILLVLGKPMYVKNPAGGSQIFAVCTCIWYALRRKVKNPRLKKKHWLDYADDKCSQNMIDDIKSLMQILFIYMPLPIYWALFKGLDSKWAFQRDAMRENDILGQYIRPGLENIVNPLTVLLLIPIFELVIYPTLSKLHLLRKPLQRMTAGGLFSACGFVLVGFIQVAFERDLPSMPKEGLGELTMINNSPCDLEVSGPLNYTMRSLRGQTFKELSVSEEYLWEFSPHGCEAREDQSWMLNFTSQIEVLMVTVKNKTLHFFQTSDTKNKPRIGHTEFRIFFSTLYTFPAGDHPNFMLKGKETVYSRFNATSEPTSQGITENTEAKSGRYQLFLPHNETTYEQDPISNLYLRGGFRYFIGIYQDPMLGRNHVTRYTIIKSVNISSLYQIAPMIVTTIGEVMFSVTGLSFTYSQAAQSMKSVAQATWLLTIAFGGTITNIIPYVIPAKRASTEFFTYGVIMSLDMLVFAVMADHITYRGSEATVERTNH